MQETSEIKPKNKLARVLSLLFSLLFWVAGGIVAFVIILVIALQIPASRSFVINQALNIVNSSLLARVEVGDIDLSAFPNIKVLDARLIADGDTLASVPTLYLEPNLREIIDGRIIAHNLFLRSPNIKLLRNSKGEWNFTKIAPPTPPDTTEPKNTFIRIGELLMDNGRFSMIDSLSLQSNKAPRKPNRLQFDNIQLRDLALKISADFNTKYLTGKVKIHHLQCYDEVSTFTLNKLYLDTKLDEKLISVDKFEIATPYSSISLKASLEGLSLTEEMSQDKLNKAKIKLKIYESTIRQKDIEYIADTPIRDNLKFDIEGDFDGSFKEIHIKDLTLKPENSTIKLKGKLIDFTTPNIRYLGDLADSRIYRNDLNKILAPEISKNIPNFNIFDIRKLSFDGTTKTLKANIDALSSLGNLKGVADLTFLQELIYDANIKFQYIDLSKITNNTSPTSRLNGSLVAKGKGVDYKTLRSNIALKLQKSAFDKYSIDSLVLHANANHGLLDLSKLHIVLLRDYQSKYIREYFANSPVIDIAGTLDYKKINNPKYDVAINTKGLNLISLTDNPNSAEYLSASFSISGEGAGKEMLVTAKGEIEEFIYQERSLMPFGIDLFVDTKSETKTLFLKSDLADIDLSGNFDIESLASFGAHQSKVWSNFIDNTLSKMGDVSYIEKKYNENMKPADFTLSADIKDLSIINIFLKEQEVYSNFRLKINTDIRENEATISIDTIDLKYLHLYAKDMSIKAANIEVDAAMQVKSNTENFYIDSLHFNFHRNGIVQFNQMKFMDPFIQLNMDQDGFRYKLDINMDSTIFLQNSSKFDITNEGIKLRSDTLRFRYNNSLELWNSSVIDVNYLRGNILINSLDLTDKYSSKISATGNYINGAFQNMKVSISEVDLSTVDTLLQNMGNVKLDGIIGYIRDLSVVANGELGDPKFNIALNTESIIFKEEKVGNIELNLEYSKKNLFGQGRIIEPRRDKRFLNFKIASFPLNLPFVEDKTPSTKPIDITFRADSLPLSIAAPFIPAVRDLSGNINMNFTAKGKDLEHLNLFGNLEVPNLSTVLSANNMRYNGNINIDFDRHSIIINNTHLRNDRKDLAKGEASIFGNIELDGFMPRSYNFTLSTTGLMVLSPASSRVIPMIGGNLTIATGDNPIQVVGTLSSLDVTGDINLLNGSLTMNTGTSSQSIDSRMTYKVKTNNNDVIAYNTIDNETGDTLFTETNSVRDTVVQDKEVDFTPAPGSIASNMNINMNFRIINPLLLRMEMGGIGGLTAKIGLENQSYPLNLRFSSSEGLSLTGDIKLLSGSKLSYIKQFEAEGTISFPTGIVSNPMLKLQATHKGRSYLQDVMRDYKVFMNINGYLAQPSIRFTYEFDNETAKGDSTQIFQDALALIIFGRTKTEMEQGMRTNSTEYGSMGMGVVTQQFSDFLSNMLQGSGSIESVEIDMGSGSNFNEARLRATGRLFDRIGWRYGSDLNDLSQNTEFSLEVPISLVIDSNYLNNFVWQFSTSSNIQQTAINRNQKDWEIKLRFGGSW